MKGENRNKILKYILQICAVFVVLGFTSIAAYANECGGSYCKCDYANCKGKRCWGNWNTPSCVGHSWQADPPKFEKKWTNVKKATCTTKGQEKRKGTIYHWCLNCDKDGYETLYEYRNIAPLGHKYGKWTKASAKKHNSYCARSKDNGGCGGKLLASEAHGLNKWHQNGDGYRHRECVKSDGSKNGDSNGCDYEEHEPNILTINFDANGGSGAPASITLTYNNSTSFGRAQRSGYAFMGWGATSSWTTNTISGGSASSIASFCGQDLLNNYKVSVTLYAQWERTITYSFYYWNGYSGSVDSSSVCWHNDESGNRTLSISSVARGDKTRLGQWWTFDGFDYTDGYRSSGSCDVLPWETSFSVPLWGSNQNFYAKYHTTVTMTYVDYATDEQKTRYDSDVAYMNWSYSSHTEPSFVTPYENTMKFTEASAKCKHGFDATNGDDNSTTNYTRCALCKQEQWDSLGWAFENTASVASVRYAQGAIVTGDASGHNNVNRTFYGRYSKVVRLTYDYNGGSGTKDDEVYTRQANAYNVEAATVTSFVLPSPTYKASSGITQYSLGAWTSNKVDINNDFDISSNYQARRGMKMLKIASLTSSLKNDDLSLSQDITPTNIVGKNFSVSATQAVFKFIPRVSDTIYASWTNQTAQTEIEPKVSVVKSVKWKTPTSDNSVVDFDNMQNIDIDGKVVVTLDVTVENKNGYQLTNFRIDDYINTDMWEYLYVTNQSSGISGFTYTRANGGITFYVENTTASEATYKVTYELQLKENYWDVENDENLYINKIPDIDSYLNSLTNKTAYSTYDSANNYNSTNGILDSSNMYYCESTASEQSYVKATYYVKNGRIRSTERIVHYATPYVVMRQVNWKPIVNSTSNKEVSQLTIQNGSNVYHNIDSEYRNTYFVQYDTKSTDSSNSTFNIYSNSSIRRSYDYYQITDNLLDIRTTDGKNQVIDSNIGLNANSSTIIKDSTANDANTSQGEALKISAGNNTHNTVTAVNNVNYYTVKEVTAKIVAGGNVIPAWIGQKSTEAEFKYEGETTINGKPAIIWTKKVYQDTKNYNVDNKNVEYKYGGLTSVSTLYATNQDGLEMNIYPYVRTTNGKTGATFETTRDTSVLQNQRINVTIDASDPIITPDSKILTESDEYGEWTESDGYIDINLVNNATNPVPQEHTLVFKFEDEVSGINSPYATNEDWINTTSDNIHVTLKRVDNDEITLYDSEADKTNADNRVVKIAYDSSTTMNHTGSISVVLDPENDDILGHLQLTIRVYDNVSNWTEKVYDLYVFSLSGAVEISDTLPYYNSRLLELDRFANGELGFVKVEASGYVDRVTVTFGEYLEKLYNIELGTRKNFISDTVTSINGDYPYDDAKNAGTDEDSTFEYLPYSMQVKTWGYTEDKLGGLKIKQVELKKYTQNVNNSILQEHLANMIERYQGMNQGISYEVEKGSDYAIVGSTLYTYPVMNGNEVVSYVDQYELGGETYYDNMLYPAYITLDGTKGITITYQSVVPDEDSGARRKIVASVEDTTEVILSKWVQVGDGYLRPFLHYFYMPLEAKQKTASDPYYVTLTAYKDSEKDFKHHASIRVSFYNDLEPIHRTLETYIKDN